MRPFYSLTFIVMFVKTFPYEDYKLYLESINYKLQQIVESLALLKNKHAETTKKIKNLLTRIERK
jgi:hypothetical protein